MILHLTALDYSFWLIEFVIELTILVVAFRKSMLPLSAYATARAVFDVLTFAATFWGGNYELAFWVVKPLEYFFQIILAVTCVGYMVRGKRTTVRLTVLMLSMLATMAVMLTYGMAPLKYSRMLDIEMSLNVFLAIGLMIGLAFGYPERAWKIAAYGMIVLGCSDTLLGLLTTHFRVYWDFIARMYPACEIVALGLIFEAARVKLPEFRQSLEKKFPKVEEMRVM